MPWLPTPAKAWPLGMAKVARLKSGSMIDAVNVVNVRNPQRSWPPPQHKDSCPGQSTGYEGRRPLLWLACMYYSNVARASVIIKVVNFKVWLMCLCVDNNTYVVMCCVWFTYKSYIVVWGLAKSLNFSPKIHNVLQPRLQQHYVHTSLKFPNQKKVWN